MARKTPEEKAAWQERHDRELEERRQARAAEREEAKAARDDPANDPHWIKLAGILTGIAAHPDTPEKRPDLEPGKIYSPADALAWSQRQSQRVAKPIDEQLRELRPSDMRTGEAWPLTPDEPIH